MYHKLKLNSLRTAEAYGDVILVYSISQMYLIGTKAIIVNTFVSQRLVFEEKLTIYL